jgi:hypothetical protein
VGIVGGMERKQVERRELWRQQIVEQKKSGGSIRAYCKGVGIPRARILWLAAEVGTETPVTFALVETIQPIKEAALIEIVLAQGAVLQLEVEEGRRLAKPRPAVFKW